MTEEYKDEMVMVRVRNTTLDKLQSTFGYGIYDRIYILSDNEFLVQFNTYANCCAWESPMDDDVINNLPEATFEFIYFGCKDVSSDIREYELIEKVCYGKDEEKSEEKDEGEEEKKKGKKMKIYDGYERLDLTEGMRHKDKPNGPIGEWFAGNQLTAMEYYRPEKFKVLHSEMEQDCTGEIYGVGVWDEGGPDQRFVLWMDSFGTCSGCDCLEGNGNGYEYIEDVLRSNTWQFLSLDDMHEYLDEPHERFYWKQGILLIQKWIACLPRWRDLKPCPFCGGQVIIYKMPYINTPVLTHPHNDCILSKLENPITGYDLDEKWNRRVGE